MTFFRIYHPPDVCLIQALLHCHLIMSLRRVQVAWNSPTLPEISSFPRNSRKSVTLSRTATLQWRQTQIRVEEDRWHQTAKKAMTHSKTKSGEIAQSAQTSKYTRSKSWCAARTQMYRYWKSSYRITFLIKRKNASLEEVQKLFPYIAICWWGEKTECMRRENYWRWAT